MRFWTNEELYEIEETLLDRKHTIKYLPDKSVTKIEWPYEEWEYDIIEQCANFGCPIESIAKFLYRSHSDVLHHVRSIGYVNWHAYCEAVQGCSNKAIRRAKKVGYRDIIEAAIGHTLTKEECVHHVNCDHHDDVLQNLWVCNQANHKHAHKSYRDLQKALIAYGVITFDRSTGDYGFDVEAAIEFEKHWNAVQQEEQPA